MFPSGQSRRITSETLLAPVEEDLGQPLDLTGLGDVQGLNGLLTFAAVFVQPSVQERYSKLHPPLFRKKTYSDSVKQVCGAEAAGVRGGC